MQIFILCFEMIGTISFALSGAMIGLKKNMDIFGVSVLGVTTAVGGGVVRDTLLGLTPPATFMNPKYVVVAILVSVVVFFLWVRQVFNENHRWYERTILAADSAGLGIFTVCGASVALDAGYADNTFLVIFVAVVTGVGGGVLRDIFAGDKPYIFVKHIYACAALFGAVLCVWIWPVVGRDWSMLIGFFVIVTLRFCSAKFRWNLPRTKKKS